MKLQLPTQQPRLRPLHQLTTVTTTQNVTQPTTATIEKCQIGTIRCFENKVQSCLDPSGEGWVTTLDCGGDSQCVVTGTNTASCQRYELTNASSNIQEISSILTEIDKKLG